MKPTTTYEVHSLELPLVRKISIAAPLQWLYKGWQDYLHHFWQSSLYGLVFVVLGVGVMAATWQSPILIMTFVTGFLLVAPFLCIGLYDLSRHHERKQPFHWRDTLNNLLTNRWNMGLLIVFQAVAMIAWIRLTALFYALYVSYSGTSVSGLLEQLFTTPQGLGFVAVFIVSGAVLASLIFVTSVIAWPMLLDRNSNLLVAIGTSYKAVRQNLAAMLVWAYLIVALIALGFASFMLGLVVILPVIGHATWHAYRELVE